MEKYDIIVLGGQSNAQGSGRGPVDAPYVPDPRILMLTDDANPSNYEEDGQVKIRLKEPAVSSLTVAQEDVRDGQTIGVFALPFAKYYADTYLEADRKLLIVYAPVGGTGFARKEWGLDTPLYDRMVRLTREAMAMNPEENRVVAFLWHQGEHDAFENADWDPEKRYKAHKENLSLMLADFYRVLGDKNVPFITAGFCDEWYLENKVACDAVLDAMKDCCKDYNSAFIDTAGLKSNHQEVGIDDVIHFCRSAQYILGDRFFAAYRTLRK